MVGDEVGQAMQHGGAGQHGKFAPHRQCLVRVCHGLVDLPGISQRHLDLDPTGGGVVVRVIARFTHRHALVANHHSPTGHGLQGALGAYGIRHRGELTAVTSGPRRR